ncbi:MAG TPA: bifunctional YncE family protein/alkaline phosphatase family protein [Candidatus Acidoferrales bacterium]|nr:bifunctional YncE family protein/alkaline phosphatase family protein [Candidatus Acidoferrales bacterium]
MNSIGRCFILVLLLGIPAAHAQQRRAVPKAEPLPTGVEITPAAAPGAVFETLNPGLADFPDFVAGQAVSTAISPDGKTLLVLTSGYNLMRNSEGELDKASSNEYVFLYDVSGGKPQKKQVLQIPNSFMGLTWNPRGNEFYASGGSNDSIHVFRQEDGKWAESTPAIALGHERGLGVKVRPVVAGLAVNPDGTLLLAANFENDSVSVVDLAARRVIGELDLRPGKTDWTRMGTPGGEYPYWVVWKGNGKAYVSSQRDREIVVLDLTNGMHVAGRIPLRGQPNKMILGGKPSRLYVALHSTDKVAVIDTATDRVVAAILTSAPLNALRNGKGWKGSSPNSLEFFDHERMLLVTNGGGNNVAVISLGSSCAEPNKEASPDQDDESDCSAESRVVGLIPTGWYPTSASVGPDGRTLYIVNAFSMPGPNPKSCRTAATLREHSDVPCRAANQYILQKMKAGLLTVPMPSRNALEGLTRQVARNNHWGAVGQKTSAELQMAQLRNHIKHVIYVVKENRTYDQVLGDSKRGNGDPKLAVLPEPITPNHHRLAQKFVTLDNFYASGNVSGDGWNWSTAARAGETTVINVPMNYAHRNIAYDFEGTNREVNVGEPTLAGRKKENPDTPEDPDLLPGTADLAAPDSAEGEAGAGYLWDGAKRAGISMRNYGFFVAPIPDETPQEASGTIPIAEMPYETKTVVAYPTKAALFGITDLYFRGFDTKVPDFFRFKEFDREFRQYEKNGVLPGLILLRLPSDHFGTFQTTLRGVNTVETQMADNDYALGLLAEKVSHSRFRSDTLIFVVEDDAQNGPDHVDAHRTIAFVMGAYVKRGAVVSQRYNTVSMLRTIEDVLGIDPLGLYDASIDPMAGVFQPAPADWSYTAVVPEVLRTTALPLPPAAHATNRAVHSAQTREYAVPRHDAAYWEEKTKGLDFTVADKLDTPRFNHVLWEGLKGEDVPYPEERDGRNLRLNRQKLLKQNSPK